MSVKKCVCAHCLAAREDVPSARVRAAIAEQEPRSVHFAEHLSFPAVWAESETDCAACRRGRKVLVVDEDVASALARFPPRD